MQWIYPTVDFDPQTASEKPSDIDQPLRIFLSFLVAMVFSHERIWTIENYLTLHGMENHTLLWQVVEKELFPGMQVEVPILGLN